MTRKKAFRYIIIAIVAIVLGAASFGALPAYAQTADYKDDQVFVVVAQKEDGSAYSSGVPTTQAVSVTMKFKNTPATSVRFQYAEVRKGTQYTEVSSADWKPFAENNNDNTGGLDVTRTFNVQNSEGESYYYFRSLYTISEQDEEGKDKTTTYVYSDEQILCVYITPAETVTDFPIKAEARKNASDSIYREYDGAEWIANDIRYTVSAPKGVDCFYLTETSEGAVSERIPLAYHPDNFSERVLTVSKETFPSGFDGTIRFSYNDPVTGEAVNDDQFVRSAKFDPVSPEFQVRATYTDPVGNIEEYQSGMTSASAVTYEISSSEAGQNLSGVKFYYYTSQNPPSGITDSGVTEVALVGGRYLYTAYATTKNLRFMAVSGSGVIYLQHERNYETVIDSTAPIAQVTATDGRGLPLTYQEGDENVWASQSVTFVLRNLANNEGAKFEYRAEGETVFRELPTVNGLRQITLNFPSGYEKSTLKGQSVYFRITSAAGVASAIIPFRYNLAKSDFSYGFSMDEFVESVWTSEPLNLRFTTDTMDYTFGYRVQDNSLEKPFVKLEGEWEEMEEGNFIFRTKLAGSVNGYAVNFYAVNLAGVECKDAARTPTTLKLDTENAKLDLKGALNGAASGSYIEEGQWVNGNVNLTFFSAGPNISGYTIIKLIRNGDTFFEDGNGELRKDANGNYGDSLAYTGVYYYKVKTGAGKEEIISYRVNIDDTAITMKAYEVKLGDDGDWMSAEEAKRYLAATDVSQNVFLKFYSNHTALENGVETNHFVYFYSVNGGVYTKGDTSGIYMFDLSGKNDNGEVRISFYLESTAIDSTGQATNTRGDAREITFRYNRIGASLTVQLDTSKPNVSVDDWNYGAVTFILGNDKDIGEAGVFSYQYSTDEMQNWATISTAALRWDSSTRTGSFEFGGNPLVHLNGKIYFRVLNAAGYSSGEPVAIPLKIDTVRPDALRSVDFGDVQYTIENDTLYYFGNLKFRAPVDESYAPTWFYYATTAVERPASNAQPNSGSGWTLISGDGVTISQSSTVSFYATNLQSSDYKTLTVSIDNSSDMKLDVRYSLVDGVMNGNLFLFRWAETNRILLNATGSATDVKYYYSVNGSGVWTEMRDQSTANSEWQVPGAEFSYVFSDAMLENVVFKAVNKGGKTVYGGQAVVLRIDTTTVTFDINATVDGRTYDVATYPNDGWSNYDILFEIEQISTNPSGVNYQYALGSFDESVPADGDWRDLAVHKLSSLLLDNKNNGNLQGTLWMRAAKNAAPTMWTQRSLPFRVDKLDPNFEMEATYTDASGALVTIKSGEWFNSLSPEGSPSAIVVSLTNREESYDAASGKIWKNASPVQYSYRLTGEWIELDDPYAFTYNNSSRSKVTFRAISAAGKEVQKTFELNIDNVAPVFQNGNSNQFSIANGENGALNVYYVDQVIRWENESEESLDFATVNGLPLINGGIVSTHDTYLGTPGTEEYGEVTIIVQDKAGNKTELRFILRPFPLTVETISLSAEDTAQLKDFKDAVADASGGAYGALIDNARRQYFTNLIDRLSERQVMLQTEIDVYKDYLRGVYEKASFTLESDYKTMKENVDKYNGYPIWQQILIRSGSFQAQTTVDYQKAYEIMLEKFGKLNTLMQQVLDVETQVKILPAVKVVDSSDYENVMKAYAAYQSLSSDQKSGFDNNLAMKLENLKKRCEILLLQNSSIGVSIDGENLKGGAMLSARIVASDTEDFAVTQRRILSGYSQTEPRALLKLIQLSITDLGSDASASPTGIITIHLSIPDEYQSYMRFGVYSVDANGTVTKIENVQITADGKYVTFQTNGLGTFALTNDMKVVDKTNGGQVYGTIFGIVIDGNMIVYILIGVGALILVLILVVILTSVRRKKFLKRYDARYKQGLAARGINQVPKGNKERRKHPFRTESYISETRLVTPDEIKPKTAKKKKEKKSKDEIDLDE